MLVSLVIFILCYSRRPMIFRFLAVISIVFSPLGGTVQAAGLSDRVLQSGHSLTDPIPAVLKALVASAGMRGARIERATIPGSPMDWRWDRRPAKGDPRSIEHFNVLVLTERVPLIGAMKWHNSEETALKWFMHAFQDGDGGAGARTILYATWVDITSGPNFVSEYKDAEGHIPFRDRLPLEAARWEQIRSYVNARRPSGSAEMLMIPGPALMAAIYDDIQAGRAPEGTRFEDLFKDKIHNSDLGAYYIALAHFAVIYQRDPRGLTAQAGLANPPSPAQAKWMQELVWKVVTGTKGTGL